MTALEKFSRFFREGRRNSTALPEISRFSGAVSLSGPRSKAEGKRSEENETGGSVGGQPRRERRER